MDTEEAVAAEVGAALRISQRLAATRVGYARAIDLAGVQPGAHLDAERLHRVTDRHRTADRSLRAVEHCEEAVSPTSRHHLPLR